MTARRARAVKRHKAFRAQVREFQRRLTWDAIVARFPANPSPLLSPPDPSQVQTFAITLAAPYGVAVAKAGPTTACAEVVSRNPLVVRFVDPPSGPYAIIRAPAQSAD